ncbi:MAG: XdhC family protein [Candidatus Aegiribacteria sp.]|nr:XdhC family protein [Candidatus Aegiribacteria sp.]
MNNPELWVLLRESLKKRVPCAFLLTLKTEGSGPGRPGAAMAVISGGKNSGTIGGGCMEQGIIRHALLMLEQGNTSPEYLVHHHCDPADHPPGEGQSSGMICSGSQITASVPMNPEMLETVERAISILESDSTGILRLSPNGLEIQESDSLHDHSFTSIDSENWKYSGPLGLSDTVYIIGGGHVGRALAELLVKLPFKPVILDERKFQPGDSLLPCRWIEVPFIDSHKLIPQGDHSWAVIMTPCHSADAAVLKSLCGINLRYVGLMASKSKKEKLFKDLSEAGVSEDFLDSVHSPIGLPIGSRTPDEIAVSIAAELIALFRKNLLL